jgi:polar amino acid transport system substrate-binding protein
MRSLDGLRPGARWTTAAIVLLCCIATRGSVAAQNTQLKLVSTAWPPFTNAPKQPRFALDLVEAALGRIGVTASTAIISAPQYTAALVAGLFDGSAAAWKDPDRERDLLFSQPYLENRLVLVGRHGADVSAKVLPDLKGKRVAIVEGYSYGETIDTAGPVWIRSRGDEDSLTQLMKGGVDYTLMDELVVQYIVSNYPKESGTKLEIGSTPLVTRGLYLALKRTRADAQSIIDRFNAQIRGMIADRTYHRMLHVDWILADVDGDGVPELVPRTDQAGSSEPLRAYTLFSPPSPPPSSPSETPSKPGFYVGGNVYADWASVPENYKVSNSDKPDPRRSTGTLFKFTW